MKRFAFSGWALVAASVSGLSQAETAPKQIPLPVPPASQEVAQVEFDSNMLFGSVRGKDVKKFAKGNPVTAGRYRLDVYLNTTWLGKFDVQIQEAESETKAVACLNPTLMARIPIDYAAVAKETSKNFQLAGSEDSKALPESCLNLPLRVPGATAQVVFSELRLDLTVPQKFLERKPRGHVSPSEWSNGVTAGTLNYNFNHYNTQTAGTSLSSSFLGLQAGLNVGAFRLRHTGSLTGSQGALNQYKSLNTHVRTDITPLKGSLTLGSTYTDGGFFDSVSMRGLTLASDERMLPSSLRGYAPTVRGTANSNAKVTVSQNGVVLYETAVAPGPFEINDLFATGYGGDLTVTVTESNGTQFQYVVPFASTPQLLRAGSVRYHVSTGELNESNVPSGLRMTVGTLQYGLNDWLTLNGGFVASDFYTSHSVGVTLGTPVGSFSGASLQSDLTSANKVHYKGDSYKLGWSAVVPATKTNVAVATYLQSTENYYGLRDAMGQLNPGNFFGNLGGPVKDRLDLSLSQNLGNAGSLFANYSKSTVWKGMPSTTQYHLGWNKNWRSVLLGLAAIRTYTNDRQDDRLTVSLSMPLGAGNTAPSAQVSVTSGNLIPTSSQASVYGTLGEHQEYGYGVSASNGPQGTTSGLNGSYTADKATLRASLGQGSTYTQYSLSASGGLVAHRGGLTASQTLGDTVAIVEAPGAEGASLRYLHRVNINDRNFAVIPYLEPYALNAIEIDSNNLGFDTSFKNSTEKVVPRAGTVSYVKFETEKSYFLVMQLDADKGSRLPFGASVTDASGQVVGAIGQGGKLQAHVAQASGVLYVDMDGPQGEMCEIAYQVPNAGKQTTIQQIQGQCRMVQRPVPPAPRKTVQVEPSQAIDGMQLSAHGQ